MKRRSNEELATQVSVNTIIWNVILSAFKLSAGIFSHSAAMVSDAVHSISDVMSTFIVIFGIRISAKESDKEHPYGHERFESVAAVILAVLLGATGAGIGYGGISNILSGDYNHLTVPGVSALAAAIVSIIVKEAMYWYTRQAATEIRSGAMLADAWHHRSDALSSVGSLIGIIGARMGFEVLDSVACLVICLFILKTALRIFITAVKELTDTACSDGFVEEVRGTIMKQEGVTGIDRLRTRLFGSKVYIDVDISTYGEVSLFEGHEVAQHVHDIIEETYPDVKHCMVHVNPYVRQGQVRMQNIK